MKALSVIVALAVGGGLAWMAVNDGSAVTDDRAAYTGCLRSGSASTVFLLRGATAAEGGAEGQGRRDYLLVSIAGGIDLNATLNHRVTITGTAASAAEGPAPPEGANTAERALQRLTVEQLADVAPDCSEPR
jgi:hypothetical protein